MIYIPRSHALCETRIQIARTTRRMCFSSGDCLSCFMLNVNKRAQVNRKRLTRPRFKRADVTVCRIQDTAEHTGSKIYAISRAEFEAISCDL